MNSGLRKNRGSFKLWQGGLGLQFSKLFFFEPQEFSAESLNPTLTASKGVNTVIIWFFGHRTEVLSEPHEA